MDLDIVPQYDRGNLKLKVLWKGKPVSGSTIHIRGSNRFQRKLKTDVFGAVQRKKMLANTVFEQVLVKINQGEMATKPIRRSGTVPP